jgi:hypothetical protein
MEQQQIKTEWQLQVLDKNGYFRLRLAEVDAIKLVFHSEFHAHAFGACVDFRTRRIVVRGTARHFESVSALTHRQGLSQPRYRKLK